MGEGSVALGLAEREGLATRASRRLLIPGWGASNKRTTVPHYVRHFLPRSAFASKLASLPGIKNAPGKAGGTVVLLFAEREGFEPPEV